MSQPVVSVIVPVYNAGPYLEECIGSILRQTLGADSVEGILVDDGSTDDSPARLDALAALHPRLTVVHQDNSGWPGKPRNVGIDLARGTYLFFLDNDDTLAPEAMADLVGMADRTGADVVLGRMAGFHRAVAQDLFTEDRDRATLADADLMDALTPHKLFRRAFVETHGLRFPEGRRRLEDHPFVISAYFLASTISILSSTVCYYHIRRDDGSNAGLRRFDPAGYYANLRESIDIIESHTSPGRLRDRVLSRYARAELLGRLRDRPYLEHPEAYRDALYEQVKAVIDERIPTTVDAHLAPIHRVQMALVRADRPELVYEFARGLAAFEGFVRLDSIRRAGGALTIGFTADLVSETPAIDIESDDASGGAALRLPPAIQAAVNPEIRRLPDAPIGTARIVLRRRDDWAELFGPSVPILTPDRGAPIRVTGVCKLDLATISAGRAIWPGKWDALVRLTVLGLSRDVRLGAVRDRNVPPSFKRSLAVHDPPVDARPYWTEGGDNLSLRVSPADRRPIHRRLVSKVRRRLSAGKGSRA